MRTENTLYVGGLAPEVTEDILFELFLQAAPVVDVHLPLNDFRDGSTSHKGFGFVALSSVGDAKYATDLLDGIRLFGRPIRVRPAQSDVLQQSRVAPSNATTDYYRSTAHDLDPTHVTRRQPPPPGVQNLVPYHSAADANDRF